MNAHAPLEFSALPEWTDMRYFLEVARAGTLSGAARRLGVEHTTVARRVQRLEVELKSTLFDRRREGYELTEIGQALLPHAEVMERAMLAAAEQLGGPQTAARGAVRLGAPEVFGTLVVATRLAPLLEQHPDLRVDLLLLPRFANLANREADIGVMLDPPDAGRYMVTRLTEFRYYLYAAPSYLEKHGPIRSRADLAGHDFIDYVQDQLMSAGLNYLDDLGIEPRRRFCCTGMLAQYEAAVAGIGLIMAPPYAVPDDGRLLCQLPGEIFAHRTLWLVAPADIFRLRRVRVVWDHLRQTVEQSPGLFQR
ncbi:MAG: LysR family transcriptional regulator [Gammaproteobacteria bacterium]|nr:LysR family transcriptional regulator [Gammaproteobacteria bacterium]MBU1645875.1 LysR family transcriptional regulator [Gammaproteobacteria bacterium]MBU1971937.1 LysR family transcriptional regulator [Gammaproteobacteria bacterium]